MKRRKLAKLITIFTMFGLLTGCGASGGTPDDYATNEDYTSTEGTATSTNTTTGSSGISKDSIKVGVLYISDPSEGSGYSYTHDLGIQGMQENLGLDSDQIVRKIADDGDAAATEKAIKDCISEGCNIIFTTSWGYMETTAALAEQYPDVYFSHGTGYLSNGKNFNNYFGRIYQARYLSGIVAGMNTKSNKIGYVAAQDSSNSEVTGGIDAFAIPTHRFMLSLQTAGTIRTKKKPHPRNFLIWDVMLWRNTVIPLIHRHLHRSAESTVSVITPI